MLTYFLVAVIMFPFLITNLTFWFWIVHVLWFDLDLSTNKNNQFVQLLHALSFVGSYIVMVTATVLLVILNPDFIAERARLEHHSVAFAWALNILIHYVPPVILTADLLLSTEHIRKRHRIHLNYRGNNSRRSTRMIRDALKVVWAYGAPIGLVGIWLAAGFTIEGVYGVTNYKSDGPRVGTAKVPGPFTKPTDRLSEDGWIVGRGQDSRSVHTNAVQA
ncbi:hypothetical protein SAMD00019534_100990 [Acytostelium subglobosum LB1]|uniref:hypothetical protein n=1 Tax=Acytostelium subglobosum LB1 TaxID=1410327 RepID=UPI000644E627|nr:hypothetical protein SAMD00019534_100990 [Acytostelium subglobosum LB1]GAM26924.1 hypothetical protein SAMD00019534_100990 [Acytostelium subglobosum LB1]|eukprot:XP_012750192.1 hypothetical protein SAMD00019534_100990 [Acytostelium subglobosum LB1]